METVSNLNWASLAMALAAALLATGCGTPGTPLPPSLHLPDPVTDLSAVRNGDRVSLTWTMPKKNTEKMLLKGDMAVRICRKEANEACVTTPGNLTLAPGAQGTFTDTLPTAKAAGTPRVLDYFVELKNQRGRSAGLSNAAQVLAGEAPAAVAGLSAKVRKGGVVLRWDAEAAGGQQSVNIVIRLHRKLLTPQAGAKPKTEAGLPAAPAEPVEQTLLVDGTDDADGAGQSSSTEAGKAGQARDRALDKGVRFGQVYEYRAQRVARVTVDGKALELAGPISGPMRVETLDVFPPAVPTGLAAVATAADAQTGASIDLSWQPVADADLAGYAVYRREGDGAWQQISPTLPVVGPAFHDANVQPGHTYRYAVTAIDQGGHASARSVETEETVPGP
jgi:hypothetical protein